MKIAVLGAGSWGTTIASLLAQRHDTVLWARNPDVAKSIGTEQANPVYLPGFELAIGAHGHPDLEEAVRAGGATRHRRSHIGIQGACSKRPRRLHSSVRYRWSVWPRGSSSGSFLRMTEVMGGGVLRDTQWPPCTGPDIARGDYGRKGRRRGR